MDSLPDELLLHVLSFLHPSALTKIQQLSKRFFHLARDGEIWKILCFDHSRSELNRRRVELLESYGHRFVSLRTAISSFRGHADGEQPVALREPASTRRQRALASWDPSNEDYQPDWCQEYKQRHGAVSLGWFDPATTKAGDSSQLREAIGMGVLRTYEGEADKVVAPMDDGSVCIWQANAHSRQNSKGRLIAHTAVGLLADTRKKNITNEPGAIDSVSIDSHQNKAYIAAVNTLVELDLTTLQPIHRRTFPFSITSLSAVNAQEPLTVGTTNLLYLHDTRLSTRGIDPSTLSRTELIAGAGAGLQIPTAHAELPESGPLALTHIDNDIWVAGRFTSLLRYDRRVWPRVTGSLFSGARLSSLTVLPQTYAPRARGLLSQHPADTSQCTSLLAAGEYKGKGSLEQYNIYPSTTEVGRFANRTTAAHSRLLAATAHGARLVFSDADGNIKWMEPDAFSLVRDYNINTISSTTPRSSSLFGTTASNASDGDIVQKLTTTHADATGDLLLWTADGRIGLLEFAHESSLHPADDSDAQVDAESEADEQSRIYGERMRRALEAQANEARQVRGLGMPYMF